MATGASRELEITAFVASTQLPTQDWSKCEFSLSIRRGTLGVRAILLISVLGKLRQNCLKFKFSQGYRVRPCSTTKDAVWLSRENPGTG